jgi:hypothetical protein
MAKAKPEPPRILDIEGLPYSALESRPEYAQAIGMISVEIANLELLLGELTCGAATHIAAVWPVGLFNAAVRHCPVADCRKRSTGEHVQRPRRAKALTEADKASASGHRKAPRIYSQRLGRGSREPREYYTARYAIYGGEARQIRISARDARCDNRDPASVFRPICYHRSYI